MSAKNGSGESDLGEAKSRIAAILQGNGHPWGFIEGAAGGNELARIWVNISGPDGEFAAGILQNELLRHAQMQPSTTTVNAQGGFMCEITDETANCLGAAFYMQPQLLEKISHSFGSSRG